MKILSVNAGSSSLKAKMFEMPEKEVLISFVFERIGLDASFYRISFKGEKIQKEAALTTHTDAVEILTKELIDYKVINSIDEIKGVGHRCVHGGDGFDKSVIIDQSVIDKIKEYIPLAPLHNPPVITGINAFQEKLPNVTHIGVFDTAFHQTMPEENFIYPVPYSWYTDYKVRKYGFHGTSHKYVSLRINEILGRSDTKIITCHIGNGASISAIENGKCIDTSMGFTPNAGVVMGTRSGDIDASIVAYMINKLNMSATDIDNALNKESGLLGISGVSSDSRDIMAGIKEGNNRCVLAEKIYVNKIVNYIAQYYVELGGADAIVFTAGVGENAVDVRKEIVEKLSVFGITLDEEKNKIRGEEIKITTDQSKIPCYVIPTDEELMIATDTFNLIN